MPVHHLYPDRDTQGRFIEGHPKLGGRRWTGGPRKLSRKIQRFLNHLANPNRRPLRESTKCVLRKGFR
jgi:hypothetical protein